MKELFSLLEERQKKALAWGAGILGAALVLVALAALALPRALDRRAAEVRNLRRQFDLAEKERAGRSESVARWEEAAGDLERLRKERFYSEERGIDALRLDLQRIFAGTGPAFPDAQFAYSELDKERARKVTVTFSFQGPYGRLKEFLARVEREDRFLFLERVVFQDIDTGTGNLVLKLTLAAYYAL